jgi:hypothetical protein
MLTDRELQMTNPVQREALLQLYTAVFWLRLIGIILLGVIGAMSVLALAGMGG